MTEPGLGQTLMMNDLLISGQGAAAPRVATEHGWTPYAGPDARAMIDASSTLAMHDPVHPSAGVRQRRREPRYLAIENRLWMQWWEEGEYLGRSAHLVNVSRHGAMIVTWVLLREQQRLRLFLEEPAPQVGVDAAVLGVLEAITGMHQIRLGFLTPCPELFIDAAANGFQSWLSGRNAAF